MKIVEVSDRYINYLKKYFPKTLLDNKQGSRKHTRKYLGVIFKLTNTIILLHYHHQKNLII